MNFLSISERYHPLKNGNQISLVKYPLPVEARKSPGFIWKKLAIILSSIIIVIIFIILNSRLQRVSHSSVCSLFLELELSQTFFKMELLLFLDASVHFSRWWRFPPFSNSLSSCFIVGSILFTSYIPKFCLQNMMSVNWLSPTYVCNIEERLAIPLSNCHSENDSSHSYASIHFFVTNHITGGKFNVR